MGRQRLAPAALADLELAWPAAVDLVHVTMYYGTSVRTLDGPSIFVRPGSFQAVMPASMGVETTLTFSPGCNCASQLLLGGHPPLHAVGEFVRSSRRRRTPPP
jgi:hypothetical protein